jgi:hypothetical protein
LQPIIKIASNEVSSMVGLVAHTHRMIHKRSNHHLLRAQYKKRAGLVI